MTIDDYSPLFAPFVLFAIRHYCSLFAIRIFQTPKHKRVLSSIEALAAASLIQFQLEKKNDPVHLFWMLYRQASRHTKHRTPHTCASFRPRFHVVAAICLEIVIYAKCIN